MGWDSSSRDLFYDARTTYTTTFCITTTTITVDIARERRFSRNLLIFLFFVVRKKQKYMEKIGGKRIKKNSLFESGVRFPLFGLL